MRFAAITLLVLSAACSARHAVAPLSQGTAFSASSIRSQYGVQARFQGTIALGDRWVYVTVPSGGVKTLQRDRQDYWDLRVRAGLVSCKGRQFQVVSEGRASRIAPLLGLSPDAAFLDTTTLALKDTLRLDVGVPPGTDPVHSWIAIVFEWPVSGALATYELHTNIPLNNGAAWAGRQADNPAERCR